MDPNEKAVYLTFDDGPIPEVTPWVLDLLDKHNIKATYFANKAAKNTEPQWTQVYADAVQKIINRITTGDLSK